MTSSRRRLLAAGLAAALTFSLVGVAHAAPGGNTAAPTGTTATPIAAAAPATDAGAPPAPQSVGATRTVTLLTGDVVRVTMDGDRVTAMAVEPVSGPVQTLTAGDHTYVIPAAARPYLAAGTLDRRLFDVTGLVQAGYDDESTGGIPLIVQFGRAGARSARTAPTPDLPGVETVRNLPSVGGQAVTADKAEVDATWAALTSAPAATARSVPAPGTLGGGVGKIWLDGKAAASLDTSVPQVKAPQAWAAGFDGTGSTVAVLDTGADVTHPDLAGVVVDTKSFVPGEDATDDQHGHGTHVASTVAGSGAADNGVYKGVAPGAKLLVGKVLANDGYGQDSWIIAGMEWAAANAPIVSMSLGDPSFNDGLDPISQSLNELSASTGALFVVAAGNDGAPETVGAPGAADAALTIGAVDDFDNLAWFSSQGPRRGDGAIKPDLAAPGEGITAARSQLAEGEGWYTTMSGTSMATPHVAGAAAIVKQAHPDWTGERIKEALVSSADPVSANAYQVGTGRLNVPASIDGVDATGSVFFGSFDWPHDGDDPVTRTITYTNDTDAPVTLTLTDTATDEDGNAVDLADLSADEVTVPANGTAQVDVTADVDDVAARGKLTGQVVGTADTADGPVVVRTAMAMIAEQERYDLTISAKDRSGRTTGGYVDFYEYGNQYSYRQLPIDPETGTVQTQRLKPGVYNVTAYLDVAGTRGAGSKGVALVGNAHVAITDADTAVVLDARPATLVSLTTPRRSETEFRRMDYFHDSGLGIDYDTFVSMFDVTPDYDSMWAAPTGVVPGDGYEFAARWRSPEPALSVFATAPKTAVPLRPVYQQGSVKLSGQVRLRVVPAGHGTPADYKKIDAKGKAVLVTVDETIESWERADAARKAGAALLILVNDVPGVYYGSAGSDELPVVSVTAAEGAKLAKATPGTARIWGHALAQPRYLFDVSKGWQGQIPTNLRLAPTLKQLATVRTTFNDSRPAVAQPGLILESRYDCRAQYWPPCLAAFNVVKEGTSRTDYVSTYQGNDWYSDVYHESGWNQRGVRGTLKAASTQADKWFAPVASARTGDGFWLPVHHGEFFAVNVPTASGPGGITGTFEWGSTDLTSTLYQGSTLVGTSIDQAVQTVVPTVSGVRRYRFEQVEKQKRSGYSTRTTSSWSFLADQADAKGGTVVVTLPMVQLGYDVSTRLDGTVKAGSRVSLGLTSSLPVGASRGGTMTTAGLSVSYDGGKTWKSVTLMKKRTGSWTATLSIPRSGSSSVSLRAKAADSAGNTVSQEITKAFGVRR